jgi:DNA-binding transcriptional MerR regulator
MLSIKDFAETTGFKQSTLRYLDELGIFLPAERSAAGYRYYSPEQVIQINALKIFSDLGLNAKKMGDLARVRAPRNMLDFFSKKESNLEEQLARLHKEYDIVHTFKRYIYEGLSATTGEITVRYYEELPYVLGPVNDFTHSTGFDRPFLHLHDVASQYHIDLNFPIGGLFDSFDKFNDKPSEPTHFFSDDPSGTDKTQAGNYITMYVKGYYGHIDNEPEAMCKYAEEHDLEFDGPVYAVYLIDEVSERDPDEYIARIRARVVPKR